MSKAANFYQSDLAADSAVLAQGPQDGLIHVLSRRWKLMLGAVAVCLLLSALWIAVAPRIYRATARFSITRGAAPTPDSRTASANDSSDPLLTQRERLSSRAVLALALTDPNTKELRTWQHGGSELSYLRQHLSVTMERGNIMSVSVDTPYADDSAALANAVVQAFAQYETEPKYSNVASALTELATQTQHAQERLTELTAAMRAIEGKYGVLGGSSAQADAALTELPPLTQQLENARLDTIKAQGDYEEARRAVPAAATSGPTISPVEVALPQQEADIREELAAAQARLVELRQRYLIGHPSIAVQQHRIDLLSRAYAQSLKQRVEASQRRESALQQVLDRQKALQVEISAATAEYGRLKFESDRMRRQLDSFDARTAAIEMARDATAITVDPFDPADAGVLYSPQSGSTLLMGLLGGAVLGATLAIGRERLDDRFRSSESASSALGLPVLGSIPAMPAGISPSLAAQRISFDPGSETADAFRQIRSAIRDASPEDRRKSILVTSSVEGDGKTVCATNLAIAMAQSGSRVLLVDANLRKPTLHTIFGVRQSLGLSALLSGRGTPAKAIAATTTRQLSLLPTGPSPASASELLNSSSLPQLMETLADMFDLIVIDGPAMSGGPDARILAVASDVTVLVVRADATSRRQAVVARDGLVGVGASVLGLVVTMAPRKVDRASRAASSAVDDLLDDSEAQPSGA